MNPLQDGQDSLRMREKRKRLRLNANKAPSIFCWKIMSNDQSAECIRHFAWRRKNRLRRMKSMALGSTGFMQVVSARPLQSKKSIQNSNTPKLFTKSFW
jgi:hypothetical protein